MNILGLLNLWLGPALVARGLGDVSVEAPELQPVVVQPLVVLQGVRASAIVRTSGTPRVYARLAPALASTVPGRPTLRTSPRLRLTLVRVKK